MGAFVDMEVLNMQRPVQLTCPTTVYTNLGLALETSAGEPPAAQLLGPSYLSAIMARFGSVHLYVCWYLCGAPGHYARDSNHLANSSASLLRNSSVGR